MPFFRVKFLKKKKGGGVLKEGVGRHCADVKAAGSWEMFPVKQRRPGNRRKLLIREREPCCEIKNIM